MARQELDVDQQLIKRLTAFVRQHATVTKVLMRKCPRCRDRQPIEKLSVEVPCSQWWRCKACGHLWHSGA